MHRRSHVHLGSRAARRRSGLFTLAAAAGLLALMGGTATTAAAGGPSSTSQTVPVKAGVKAIGRSSKPSTSGLLSVHSSAATGVVETTPAVYLVFWGAAQWSNDPAGAAPAVQSLFQNLNGSSDTWGTILTQYCENVPSGSTACTATGAVAIQHPTTSILNGVWFDPAVAPAKATTSQIAAEAVKAATHFGNTTSTSNLNAQYVIASPSGTHPDGFPRSFCAWHSSTSSADGNVAYTNLPYVPDLPAADCTTLPNPGPLDGYESTETHEYAETVTDPFPSNGWLKGGAEIGDLCETLDASLTINGATYDVQGLWSNLAKGCVTHG